MLDLALFMMGFPEPESVTASTYCKIGNKKGVGLMGSWTRVNSKSKIRIWVREVHERSVIDSENSFRVEHEGAFQRESSDLRRQGGRHSFSARSVH
jgi:hypothetical protein